MYKQSQAPDGAPASRLLALLRRRADLILCFLSLVCNGMWFLLMYRHGQPQSFLLPSTVLTLAWSLLLTGIAALLPRLPRRIYMGVVGGVFFILPIVHGVYYNMFRKFFSFADIAFAGDGFAFLDTSYLVIRKLSVLLDLLCLAIMIAGIVLSAKETEKRRARPRMIGGGCGILAGIALMLVICVPFLRGGGLVIWDMNSDPATIYLNFTDSKASMSLLGLYHYTFRDLHLTLFPNSGHLTQEERDEVETFAQSRPHEDNEMTGKLAGKNLILVQLEAIDTWMLDQDYMPNLWAVKEDSIVFANHHTPAFITAGTFNTEFMVNTGLLPAESGVSMSVYTRNAFPNSLAHLFRQAGYTAQSFHGSEGDVYNRQAVHENLGYEAYWSGSAMGMEDYTMDRHLMAGYGEMTGNSPFFSFVITYSGHGPYGPDNPIGQAHQAEADTVAKREEDMYRYAVAHAMETDLFIKELMARLEAEGRLEDTVVLFYADHYNYYLLNDALNEIIKGVDTMNQLTHTDWFIYDGGAHRERVDKVTSSLDVAPTVANLFGLEADYAAMLGYDAFGSGGGYVFFDDNSWYDGREWSSLPREDVLTTRRIGQLMLRGNWFKNEE